MQILINIVISTIVQFILVSILPFIWWLITARKIQGFFPYLGFEKPKVKNKIKSSVYCICTIIFFGCFSFTIIPMLIGDVEIATSQFQNLGIQGIIPALIYAFFQTGLSEELLFRGFLGKRFISKFGFATGNVMQAILFGLMHGVMFFSLLGVAKVIFVIVLTGAIGWILGYINEKEANGSIALSWVIHGLANTIAASVALFNLS